MTPLTFITQYIEEVRRLDEETSPFIDGTAITLEHQKLAKYLRASARRLAEALESALKDMVLLETYLKECGIEMSRSYRGIEQIADILRGEGRSDGLH